MPYIIVYSHSPPDGLARSQQPCALCLSRTSRRLTGINPGEMTRLIKQIGQNIIGSVARLSPANTTPSDGAPPAPAARRLTRRTDLMSVCASINLSHIYYCCRTTNAAIGLAILILLPIPPLQRLIRHHASSPHSSAASSLFTIFPICNTTVSAAGGNGSKG